MNIAFNNEKYLSLQKEKILDRVKTFGNKLYLEFGGKLFDDLHASRVLPGFEPDSKLKMLLQIKEHVEVVIVISSLDIQANKIRSDLNINYESEVLRLIDAFRESDLYVGSVCISQYEAVPQVVAFKKKLNNLGIKTYLHYHIDGYPRDISKIISEKGFGKNDYIETERPIVVVTAPGPGSGKMATCLSQLYHENKRGIKAGYAKYETFPIWNLPLRHPINLAYESATADLNDVNLIDPYHLDAYGIAAVNYNRDVENFPVLKAIFEAIYGECPYVSPTEMGVNMAGFAIENDEVASKAAKDEIIRRYLNALLDLRNGKLSQESIDKISMIMLHLGISVDDRKVVKVALEKAKKCKTSAMALELSDGHIVDGKSSELLSAASAVLLNALKYLANIDDKLILISPSIIEPICKMKVEKLGNENPRLRAGEVLIALAISARTNPLAELAMTKLELLANAQVHKTTMIHPEDASVLRKLKIDATADPVYNAKKLYVK